MMEDVYNEGISDGCAALAANADCSLQEETVDGVLTYSNFSPTFIVPIPTCKTFYGSFTTFLECREWWRKERKYRCTAETQVGFQRREEGWTVLADRNRQPDHHGLPGPAEGERRLGDGRQERDPQYPREDYWQPILACKTRKPKRKTDAASRDRPRSTWPTPTAGSSSTRSARTTSARWTQPGERKSCLIAGRSTNSPRRRPS